MENGPLPKKISRLGIYMPNAIKFYNLKIEYLTPVLFIIILAISLLGTIIPAPKSFDLYYYLFSFFSSIFINLATAIYLCAYIMELKREVYSLNVLIKIFGKNLFKLIIISFIYNVPVLAIAYLNSPQVSDNLALQATIAGVFILLAVPGIVLYFMFIFNTCFIVDKNYGIIKAFQSSKALTEGNKWSIFKTLFIFNMLLLMPVMFITLITASTTSISSNNALISDFVFCFILTIIDFIQQRLIALMYIDLEYGNREIQQQN